MKKTTRDTRTAAQAYKEHAGAIQALMETLRGQLAEHRKKAAAEPTHWGYVGDLEEIHQRLATAVSFLSPDEEE